MKIGLALLILSFPASALASDGTCEVGEESPVAAVSREIASASRMSDATWRKHVADAIYTTDGVWGPSTDKLKKVSPSKLNACLTNVFKGLEDADVFTTKIDGRSVYLFSEQGDGFTSYQLRDARCRKLKMGNRAHDPVPLLYPAEADPKPSRATWLKHLKEVNRRPTMMSDTPVVKREDVPAKVRAKIATLEKKYGTDEYGSFDVDVEIHKVRMDGYTSYIVYLGTYEGVAIINLDPTGKELDVDF